MKLGEVTTLFRGKYITRDSVREGLIPVILGGKEPAYYCDEANHEGPCFVISRSGASAGYVSFWDEPIFVTDGFLFDAKPEANIRYLYYCLKSQQQALAEMQNGAGIPHVRGEELKQREIPFPLLPIQRRIADILSAYDDLIENNRRRIEILEETARTLYQKMFVAEAKPEWKIKRIDEVCETIGGGTPKTGIAEYWDGDIKWVVPTDITRNTALPLLDTERKISELGLQKSSAKMLPPRTILMTSRASVGYFGVCDEAVCTNQGFISIIPNVENMRWYLLHNLLSRVEEIRGNAKGSTFAEISKTQFRGMEIVVPDDEPLTEFASVAEDLYQQSVNLSRQNAKLAAARDLLLPRLMSGRMEVA